MSVPMLSTCQMRGRFAAALSRMYGAEVPAYTMLTEVACEVNADHLAAHPGAERLGSLERITAERHGAIRVGTPAELRDVADLFAAFGMYPVGFYDLRDAAAPVPVVSTAFRPIDPQQLACNPFRVFTSMLATDDPRFFDHSLRGRIERRLADRTLFDPALIDRARDIAQYGCPPAEADGFVTGAVAAFALSTEPIDRAWYDELAQVSAVAADIAGVDTTHINHLTPRVLDIDELYARMTARGVAMIDTIQGPPRTAGPLVLLRQTSFRALEERRRFRRSDGSIVEGGLRVRFGEVEARGVALTRTGRRRYDAALSDGALGAGTWHHYFPDTDAELAAEGLAYYRDGDPREPVVYEDFLPASAAGIFRSNLDTDARRTATAQAGTAYTAEWMSGAIGREIHDPYALYARAAAP